MPLIRIAIGLDGPVVDLAMWIGPAAVSGLQRRTRPVPKPQTMRRLSTPAPTVPRFILTSSHQSSRPRVGRSGFGGRGLQGRSARSIFTMSRLAFAGHGVSGTSTQWVAIKAVAVVPADPSILALIGRDMLAYCQFVYDGPKGEVVLVY